MNLAKRLRGRSDAPSGEISIVSTTSPKVAAQASKCSMPRLCRPSGSRKRCIVYISTIVFEIGVPVANVTPWPACRSSQIPGLHVEVEGALAAPGLDAGHAVHLGRGLQVLEEVRLVDEEVIDAELVKDEAVVLLVLGQKLLEPLLAVGFLLLDGLDDVPVAATVVAAALSQRSWSYSAICSRRNFAW